VSTHSTAHDRSFGYEIVSYGIRYEAGSSLAEASFYDLRQRPTSSAVYYDDTWRLAKKMILESGARVETLTGRRWASFSPRFSAKYFVTPDMAITGAVGRFSQWTHSLAREDIPVRLFRTGVGVQFYGCVHEQPQMVLVDGIDGQRTHGGDPRRRCGSARGGAGRRA